MDEDMDMSSSDESSDNEDEDEEHKTSDIFKIYRPCIEIGGASHPGTVCESQSLAFVSSPAITIKPGLPRHMLDNISHLQAETVLLACQKMKERFSDGSRAGFYLGDGTGVGKGRVIASIFYYNYLKGRTKAVLVTAGKLLLATLESDLAKIGYPAKTVQLPDSYEPIEDRDGVLFLTYSSLYSKSKTGTTRMNQICDWLGVKFSGVLVFDESHKAKKFSTDTNLSTVTGFNVVLLQTTFPNARVVYSTATAAWEPEHLGYMIRLGLWNTAFGSPTTFIQEMHKRPVEAMELLAVELKQTGFYVARQLSFADVTYQLEVVPLTDDFQKLYNECAQLWRTMHRYLQCEIKAGNIPGKNTGFFWANHQRFFSTLCTSSKVNAITNRAKKAAIIYGQRNQPTILEQKHMAVVIGLQSTGEAGFSVQRVQKGRPCFSDPFSLAEYTIIKCMREVLEIPEMDEALANLRGRKYFGVLQQFYKVVSLLPRNPLDHIISRLGGFKQVAEMTGRTVREREMMSEDGELYYTCQYRKSTDNDEERRYFMEGVKRIIVISDAASTGISLHDDSSNARQSRRLHITAELPWGADKAIQQLGRTHRSNQESSPHYVFVISPVPAERRFTFAIAERLRQMGAITHGDRRASDSLPFTEFELNRIYTKKSLISLLKFYTGTPSPALSCNTPLLKKEKRILAGKLLSANILVWKPLTSKQQKLQSAQKLKNVIVSRDQSKRMLPNSACYDIDKFLNRLFSIDLQGQTKLFKLLEAQIAYFIQLDKDSGDFSSHIKDLTPSPESLVKLFVTRTREFNLVTGSVTLNEVVRDAGISWREARNLALESPARTVLFFKSTGRTSRVLMAIRCPTTEDSDRYRVFLPSTGQQSGIIAYRYLEEKRERIKSNEAKSLWKLEHMSMGKKKCWHEYCYRKCLKEGCSSGSRISSTYIVSGCLNKIWDRITDITHSKSLQVVKCTLHNRSKIIGVKIKEAYLKDLEELLATLEPTPPPPPPPRPPIKLNLVKTRQGGYRRK